MSEPVAFPFLRPVPARVSASPWRRKISHEEYEILPEVLKEWDYSVDLLLQRTLDIDLPGICEDTSLGAGASFLFNIYLETGELRVRRTLFQRTLSAGEGSVSLPVDDLKLEGSLLQGGVELITVLSLAQGEREGLLAPVALGSRLWEDRFNCKIEGGAGRLPMESRDFSAVQGRIAHAPWYFELRSADLDNRFESAFRAILNTNRPDVHEPLIRGEPMLTSLFRADLVRHVLSQVLNSDDFTGDESDYPDGSLGAVAASWLDAAFPDEELRQVRRRAQDDARTYEAMIAAVFGRPDGH